LWGGWVSNRGLVDLTENVLRVSGAPNRACRHRTQEQLEPPVKTSAGQPRVGRPRSGRKPNSTTPNNRTGRDRYTRWLYVFLF